MNGSYQGTNFHSNFSDCVTIRFMNAIEMYDILKNIPQVSNEQARDMADTIAKADIKDLVTKIDLKVAIAELDARIFKQLMVAVGIIIAAMVALKIFS